ELFALLQATEDTGKRASLVADIVIEFRPYTEAKRRLGEVVQKIGRERGENVGSAGGESRSSRLPGFPTRWGTLQNVLNPSAIPRYTYITAPGALALGRRGVITVGLTRNPVAESHDTRPLELKLKQSLDVCLQSRQEDLEIIGESVKRISIVA